MSSSGSEWPVEYIPNPARLFLRVHRNQCPDGRLHTGVFVEHEDGMSTDWEKYSTPEESRARAARPELTGIVTLIAGVVRSIDGMDALHAPETNNRAHSNIVGMSLPRAGLTPKVRKTMVRAKLLEYFSEWSLVP